MSTGTVAGWILSNRPGRITSDSILSYVSVSHILKTKKILELNLTYNAHTVLQSVCYMFKGQQAEEITNDIIKFSITSFFLKIHRYWNC